MATDTQLYDAFGELLYVLTLADGEIQPSEVERIKQVLAVHPWGKEIQWSFTYEKNKGLDPEKVYQKVLSICHEYGPAPEYQQMLDVLEAVAEASDGVDENERQLMERFRRELTLRFRKDLKIED